MPQQTGLQRRAGQEGWQHPEDWQEGTTHTAGLQHTGTHTEAWHDGWQHPEDWHDGVRHRTGLQLTGTQQAAWQGLDPQQAGWQHGEQLVWHMADEGEEVAVAGRRCW